MKLGNPLRRDRLSRSFSVDRLWSALLLLLVAITALQAARLFWVIVAPQGPVGDWKAAATSGRGAASPLSAARFDPFFRLAADSGAVAITSLPLKLYGIRQDFASGRGSAIIATPDGIQSSFAVGDAITAGVLLKQVSADSVTISRNGADEQIFLDQSVPAAAVAAGGDSTQAAGTLPASGSLTREIGFTPRLAGGQVNGLVLNPEGSGAAFRAAGLVRGDVLLSINGRAASSLAESVAMLDSLGPQSPVSFRLERNGKPVTINTKVGN